MTTVKVSNVSLGATERDLKEFFSFSGDILYLETQRFGFLSSVPFGCLDLQLFVLRVLNSFDMFVQRD